MFVLAAAVIFFIAFLHAAFAAGFGFIVAKIPISQLAHAIMHMYSKSAADSKVENGEYGNDEFFHLFFKDMVKI
jgi:predicted phage tail protein